MFKGGITAYILPLFVPMRCLQSYNLVDESLFECLLQRLCDLSGKLESATFSAGYTNSLYSILILLPIRASFARVERGSSNYEDQHKC